MKEHLIIKLKQPLHLSLPYWEDIIGNKSGVPSSISTSIDSIIKVKYRQPYWLSYNYQPKTNQWSEDEKLSGFDRTYRLILQKNTTIPDPLIQEIKMLPEVESIHKAGIVATKLPENKIAYSSSFSQKYRDNGIFLKESHWYSKGNPEIKVAILDTGFEADHPELNHAMLPGKDFVHILDGAGKFIGDYLDVDDDFDDDVGHGTHVAGIIAGRGLKMPIGVVPNCKIIPVKVLGALKRGHSVVGAGLIDNINNGIKWAVDQGANVINMSLGVKHVGGGLPHEDVIKYALNKGVSVVAASGNDGTQDKYYPGALPGVIAVGAADNLGRVADFSTYGGHVSLIAPGKDIYSSFLNNSYALSSGTSQAAPLVSGAIALLQSVAIKLGRSIKDKQVKYLLKHTSDKISQQFKDAKAGFGILNILDAIKLLHYKFQI